MKLTEEKLMNKIPVIYADANYEGVAVRFRQQINENSKMLCCSWLISCLVPLTRIRLG